MVTESRISSFFGWGGTHVNLLSIYYLKKTKYFIINEFMRILAETDILKSFCVNASLQVQGDVKEKSVWLTLSSP